MAHDLTRLVKDNMDLRKQRDELLVIVKELRNSLSATYHQSPEGRKYLCKIDAAIAKCES